MFIDTHAHLYDERYGEDFLEMVERAKEAGISRVVMPDVDSSQREEMFSLSASDPNFLSVMVGLHPTCVNDNPLWQQELELIAKVLREGSPAQLCGVGEVGLDLYWSRDFLQQQIEALRFQLDLAIEYNLPVAFHVRDAWSEIMPIFEEYSGRLRGIVHAYSGGVEEYLRLKQLGDFKFGIGGVVTFKKASLATVVEAMELEDIVLETDAPYLTPTPHRGTRNEPSYVPLIAEKIALIKGVSLDEVAHVTTSAAMQILSLE